MAPMALVRVKTRRSELKICSVAVAWVEGEAKTITMNSVELSASAKTRPDSVQEIVWGRAIARTAMRSGASKVAATSRWARSIDCGPAEMVASRSAP